MRKHFLFSIVFCLLFSIPAIAWDHVYLIGSATTAEWTPDNAIEMTNTDNGGGAMFEWSGYLKEGELKLMTDKNWDAAQYGPAHDSYSTLSEDGKTSFNDLVQRATYSAQCFSGGQNTDYGDYKFGIKQAGYYTIRLNCNTNQITTFPKQIYPVGDGCEVGWENQSLLALTETGFASEVYEGDLKLTAEGELKILNQHAWSQYQYGPKNNGEEILGMGIYSIAGRWETEGDNKYKVQSSAAQETAYHLVADVRNGHTNVLKIEKYITLSFKLNAQARAEWGDMPVVIRYWMGYQDADDATAYDHPFYRTLTADVYGVYSTTIAAVAPIKFIIQTCNNDKHGKDCGDGAHWTNEMTNGETGYSADQKFEMVYDYTNGHVLQEVDAFTTNDFIVRSHKGYASLAWEQAFAVPEGVEAYVGVWNNGDIELHRVADGVVPAGEGVILYDTQLRNSYYITATDEAATAYRAMTNNLLGAPTANISRDESQTTYVLGDIDGVIAFYEYRGDYIPQYKAYLVAPSQQAAPQKQVRIRFASDVMSDIPSAEAAQDGVIYDVMGRVCSTRDIQDLPQGIYIRNRTRILVVK